MRKLTPVLAFAIVLQGACTSPPTTQVTPLTNPASAATVSGAGSPVPSAPEATPAPTLIPPPAMSPEFFTQAKVEHEYWPAIRQAAVSDAEADFGLTQTAWALSPDGRYVAVAGCDGEAGGGDLFELFTPSCEATMFGTVAHAFLLILDAKTEEIVATLPETGEELTVDRLAFTHDSKKLVYRTSDSRALLTGSGTGREVKIGVWDVPSGSLQAELPNAGWFEISPDDKWMAVDLADGIKLWDLATEEVIAEVPEGIFPQYISQDGQRALMEDSPYLTVYDTGTWEKVSQHLLWPDGMENTWALSPDLSLLAICGKSLPDTAVKIWNVASSELIQTLSGEWGRCGRLMFTPDSGLLLRFDEHGAGPVIWTVSDWKLVQPNANLTNFVGSEDLFVDKLQFSQDGGSALVGTFNRLSLYTAPEAAAAAAVAPAMASATAVPLAIRLPEIPPSSFDITVTGWVKAHLRPNELDRPQTSRYDGSHRILVMSLRAGIDADTSPPGVEFSIPVLLLVRDQLQTGEYIIGDATDQEGSRIWAEFVYYDPLANVVDPYASYDGGTFVITQTGQYLSGSFSFGARTEEGRQVSVEGTFENIPFSIINIPPD